MSDDAISLLARLLLNIVEAEGEAGHDRPTRPQPNRHATRAVASVHLYFAMPAHEREVDRDLAWQECLDCAIPHRRPTEDTEAAA